MEVEKGNTCLPQPQQGSQQKAHGATVLALREAHGWQESVPRQGNDRFKRRKMLEEPRSPPAQRLPWVSRTQPRKWTRQPPGTQPQRPLSALKGPS